MMEEVLKLVLKDVVETSVVSSPVLWESMKLIVLGLARMEA
jgi:ribosomal protein S25